ncbi:metallo-beta-lactamase [Klebsiella quasipneumoniae]|nr:metallo-beta-lactamase [Klebsiella quasipneumoniae]
MTPAPFYSLTAGDLTISAISDGQMTAPLTLLAGIAPEEAARLQRQAGVISPETIEIGAYLIRGRGHTVLVDTGPAGPTASAARLSPIWRCSASALRTLTPSSSPTRTRTISAAC